MDVHFSLILHLIFSTFLITKYIAINNIRFQVFVIIIIIRFQNILIIIIVPCTFADV